MKISVMSGGIADRFGLERGYAMIRETGFDAIDFNMLDDLEPSDIRAGKYRGSVYDLPLEKILEKLAPEFEQQKKNGITVTQAHAPFPAHTPQYPEVYEYMPMVYEKFIRLCVAMDCKRCVIHGINYIPSAPQDTPEKIDELNWKLFSGLIPLLKETGVIVCVENLFVAYSTPRGVNYNPGHCSHAEKAAKFIDDLNQLAGQECFGLCLDTGHLNLMRLDPVDYITTLGKRIKAMHIHDNNGMTDQHLAPYNGNIPWIRYLTALRDVGYDGDLSFETFNQIAYIKEDELVPSQLQAISAIGRLFRKRISGKEE